MADPDVKFFFLVAGYDYEAGGKKKGLDFDGMCTGRVKEWINFLDKSASQKDALMSADTILRFLRISVETGKIEVIERNFVAGRGIKQAPLKESEWKPLNSISTGDKFDPNTFVSKGRLFVPDNPGFGVLPFRAIIRATDYENLDKKYPNFKQSATANNVISIVDVYDSVRGAPDGSVLDLSVFSHGWIEGPILVNSSDKRKIPNVRDPDDKDGRASVDFNTFMGGNRDGSIESLIRLIRFMISFDPRGVMQTWGCSFDIEISLLLQTLARIKRGGITEDTIIDFEFETKWTQRYRQTDPDSLFFPPDESVVKVGRKFSDVKKFLRRRLAKSYAFQFASASPMVVAQGALPGTYAEDEKTGFLLMNVCAKKDALKGCSSGFANVFDFYQKHMGINVDRRGFGIFDVKTVQKLAADIAADTP